MFSLFGLVMIAIELYSPTLHKVRVLLNPVGLRIPDTTAYRVYAYVIAEDRKDAERLSVHGGT